MTTRQLDNIGKLVAKRERLNIVLSIVLSVAGLWLTMGLIAFILYNLRY